MRIRVIPFGLLAFAPPLAAEPRHVIVIAMENKDAREGGPGKHDHISAIMDDAPQINGELLHDATRAGHFADEMTKDRSQPHCMLIKAGRSPFAPGTRPEHEGMSITGRGLPAAVPPAAGVVVCRRVAQGAFPRRIPPHLRRRSIRRG